MEEELRLRPGRKFSWRVERMVCTRCSYNRRRTCCGYWLQPRLSLCVSVSIRTSILIPYCMLMGMWHPIVITWFSWSWSSTSSVYTAHTQIRVEKCRCVWATFLSLNFGHPIDIWYSRIEINACFRCHCCCCCCTRVEAECVSFCRWKTNGRCVENSKEENQRTRRKMEKVKNDCDNDNDNDDDPSV